MARFTQIESMIADDMDKSDHYMQIVYSSTMVLLVPPEFTILTYHKFCVSKAHTCESMVFY